MHTALPLISASQISTYLDCKRKWAWKSIAKIKPPSTASTELGIEVDDTQLQPYLRDGRTFDYTRDSGYIAASALAFLPAPQAQGIELQKHFTLKSPSGLFGYQGYIDLWSPDSGVMPGLEGGAPLVSDFKTTVNLKWQKSKETLAKDIQAMLYATYAVASTRSPVVDLAWVYMQTKGTRKASRTHLRVLQSHVAQEFKAIDATAREMFDVRKRLEARDRDVAPLELEPNPLACDSYGGCPYRHKCNLSPVNEPAFTEDDMAIGWGALKKNISDKRTEVLAEAPPVEVAGINPPEAALVVEAPKAAPAEAPKRGRPAGSKNKPKAEEPAPTDCNECTTHCADEKGAPTLLNVSNSATIPTDAGILLRALTAAASAFLEAVKAA